MNLSTIIFLLFLMVSCKSKSKTDKIFQIEVIKDSCYYLMDSAKRKVEIIENTLEDTILFGFAILPPGYIGQFEYLRSDESNDAMIYAETPKKNWPKTKMFCVNLYQKKPNKGKVVIKYD